MWRPRCGGNQPASTQYWESLARNVVKNVDTARAALAFCAAGDPASCTKKLSTIHGLGTFRVQAFAPLAGLLRLHGSVASMAHVELAKGLGPYKILEEVGLSWCEYVDEMRARYPGRSLSTLENELRVPRA